MILHRVWTLNPCDKIPDSFLNLEIIFISKCCHEFWDLVQSASFMTLSKKGTSYLPRSRSTGRWYCESQRCRCSRWSGLNVHCEHYNRVGNQRFKFSVTRFDETSRICLIFLKIIMSQTRPLFVYLIDGSFSCGDHTYCADWCWCHKMESLSFPLGWSPQKCQRKIPPRSLTVESQSY